MLGQIETGKSSPALSILAKIAAALDVTGGSLIIEADEPAAVLLTRSVSKVLSSSDGTFETRAVFPFDGDHSCGWRRTMPMPIATAPWQISSSRKARSN
ncbi:helix-turn-helix domain-containing protein [Metarhizobium album]|uniref:helix-turn-helix domain-containing protein n=1 Tax=Metarhizobium album TaxID=2182425 RepID=UPI001FE1C522|nr:helix-turn-helix transcriptional regulator [Rhizobium album]